MADVTPRWALPFPELDDVADVPLNIENLATALDDHAKDSQGTLALRPTSTPGSPGKSGRYYYATDTGQLFRDHGSGWDEIWTSKKPRLQVRHNAHQSIAHNAFTTLNFNTEIFDEGTAAGQHDPVTNNSRFTCQRTGLYMVSCVVHWAGVSPATATDLLLTDQGNSTMARSPGYKQSNQLAESRLSELLLLTAGTYYEVRAFQNSGGPIDATMNGVYAPRFSWCWLSS